MLERQVRPPSIWHRILLGLALALLVTLIGILFVSVLYPGGPASLAERGEKALQEGRLHEAIAALDEAERNLPAPRDVALLERIYTARARAHMQAGNLGFAERDLLAALGLPLPEESLDSLRISLARSVHLQRAGQLRAEGAFGRAEAELQLALKLVRGLAGRGQGNLWLQASETAGEACQRFYQLIVARIQEELRIPLSSQMLLEANRLLLELIFQPEQNPVGQILRERLEKLFVAGDLAPGRRSWVDERIRDARGWVAETFRFYGQALGPPEAFAALQGITGLLSQTGRSDEAAMLCRAALDSWESPFLGRAAERLADLHREAGRLDRARQVLAEWRAAWPPGELLRRFRVFPAQAQDAWILAMDLDVAARDGAALGRTAEELWPYRDWWVPETQRLMGYFGGMHRALLKWDPAQVEASLAGFVRSGAARPTGWVDRYRLAQEARAEQALRLNQAEKALAVLTQWIEQRPWDTAARLQRAEVLIGQRKIDEGLVDLQKAYALEPTDAILERIWSARTLLLERQGHGVEALARSLLERQALFSQDLPNRHLHLGLARHLLAQAESVPEAASLLREGALFQARLAALYYPESPSVQILLDSARLATGRSDEARAAWSSLETLRGREPDHPEILRLLYAASRTLDRPDPALERDLVRFGTGPEAFRLLSGGLLAMTFWEQALAAASRGLARFGASDPQLNLHAGDACRRLRRPRDAARFYAAVAPGTPDYWEARRRRLEVLLAVPGKIDLEGLVSDYLQPDVPPEAILEAAALCVEAGRPAAALRLARHLEQAPDGAAEGRSGRLFLLGARARFALGERQRALLEAERALGFPDGQAALAFLAPALLVDGRGQDASEVLALHPRADALAPLDMATLLALAGQTGRARELLESLAPAPPEELWGRARILALQALLGRNVPGADQEGSLAALAAEHPAGTAFTLFLLASPGWGADALTVAQRHFTADMPNAFGRLLLARARLAGGQVREGMVDLAWLVVRQPGLGEAWELLFRTYARLYGGQDLASRTFFAFQALLPIWQRRMGAAGAAPTPADLEFPSELAAILADWGRSLGQGARTFERPALAERWGRFAAHFTGLSLELLLRAHPERAHDRALEALLLAGDLHRTWQTMASALERAEGDQFARLADAFFLVSGSLPDLRDQTRAIAERLLDRREGPCGPALHFLLATDGRPASEAARHRAEQLRRHLERARKIPIATVDFLYAGATARQLLHANPEEARAAALELLDRCPAHWRAWEALALAEEALGRADQACQILAFPHRYLDRSPLLLTETTLVARLDRPGLPTEESLSSLDPKGSPAERLAVGLWRLRRGEAGEAARLLSEWPAEESPEVLFYRAEANLFARPPRPDGAGRDLEALERRFPTHPLARHAGLVLKMLGPREE